MKNKALKATILAGVCLLGGCNSREVNAVTFRTVKTEGITAYIDADYGTRTTTAEADITEEATKKTTAEISTKHYETTVPETLIGGTETEAEAIPEAAEAVAESVGTTLPATYEAQPQPEMPQIAAGGYSVVDDSGILVTDIDGHYWGIMPCWGTYSLCESWTKSVNAFKEALPEVEVYNMVVPTSSEFYVPEGMDNFTSSQWNKIEHIRSGLVNVKNVDVYSSLAAHTDEKIFSRTDHHWFPLGGYYAAQAFAVEAAVPFADIKQYKKVSKGGFVGSMYMYTENSYLYNDPETFDLYIPPNNSTLKTRYYDGYFGSGRDGELITSPDAGAYYCSFLGADTVIAEIETGIKNGRTLVIFKESYGNAVVPFLTTSFEKIYVCDIRYFYKNAVQFCKDVGATDLLFSVCTYTPAGTNGNYLKKILDY